MSSPIRLRRVFTDQIGIFIPGCFAPGVYWCIGKSKDEDLLIIFNHIIYLAWSTLYDPKRYSQKKGIQQYSVHVFPGKWLTKAFQWRSLVNWSCPSTTISQKVQIATRNNDSSTYNPTSPTIIGAPKIAAWLLSNVSCISEGLLQVQTSAPVDRHPPSARSPAGPRLRRFKEPRWKQRLEIFGVRWDPLEAPGPPPLFIGDQIQLAQKSDLCTWTVSHWSTQGYLQAADNGSMWHLVCDFRPSWTSFYKRRRCPKSFKVGWAGLLTAIYDCLCASLAISCYENIWKHWAVTFLHIKKTFLILHLLVNALFWWAGFQLTQCRAMLQNTKSGPLRGCKYWEGPVKKKSGQIAGTMCHLHVTTEYMHIQKKQLCCLKDHLLFHLAKGWPKCQGTWHVNLSVKFESKQSLVSSFFDLPPMIPIIIDWNFQGLAGIS